MLHNFYLSTEILAADDRIMSQIHTTMTTNGSLITNSVEQLIVSNVLAPLSQWLKSVKGVDASVNEMAQVLSLPIANTPKSNQIGFPQNVPLQMPSLNGGMPAMGTMQVPSYLNGGLSQGLPLGQNLTIAPRGSRTKAVDPHYNGPTCQYKFARGGKSGQFCGQPVVQGLNFCKECAKKKSGGGQTAPVSNGLPSIGGFTLPAIGLGQQQYQPQQQQMQGQQYQQPQQAQQPAETEIDVTEYIGHPNFFIESRNHFIIDGNQSASGIVVVGLLNPDNSERKLTKQESDIAHSMNFVVSPDAVDIAQGIQQNVVAPIPTLASLNGMMQTQPQQPTQQYVPQQIQQFQQYAQPQQIQQIQQQVPQIQQLQQLQQPQQQTQQQVPQFQQQPQQAMPQIQNIMPSMTQLQPLQQLNIPSLANLGQSTTIPTIPNVPTLTALGNGSSPSIGLPTIGKVSSPTGVTSPSITPLN
jgi:hypothetical protein